MAQVVNQCRPPQKLVYSKHMVSKAPNRQDQIAALEWHLQMGADEAVEETPINRFLPKENETSLPESSESVPKQAKPVPEIFKSPSDETVILAAKTAAEAKTLEALFQTIKDFEGCSLKKTAMNTVFSDGSPESGLMLIGEAPGADEDRQGKPFVGASGKLLDKMMAAIGLKRENDYYISNIIPWRPPGNRKPTPEEAAICLPFIKRHIELAKPKILMLLGGTAVTALLHITDGITRIRGRWYEYQAGEEKIPTIAIFHPAYLLRQPQLKGKAWQDLQEIEAKLKS